MMVKKYNIFINIEDRMSNTRFSQTAFMRRELGLSTGCVRSVLDPLGVKESTILKSVQNYCCLVKPVLSSWNNERIAEKMDTISSLLRKPGLDYRELHGDLLKCCKKGWTYMSKKGVFVERSTVIRGIILRAREIFLNDPTYEEQQRKELDRILDSNIRRLFFSIWCTENRF